jgi:hypothetical protein
MTIGIAPVAFCIARTAAGVASTIASAFNRTSSLANSSKRSYLPSANRYSMTKSLPST